MVIMHTYTNVDIDEGASSERRPALAKHYTLNVNQNNLRANEKHQSYH